MRTVADAIGYIQALLGDPRGTWVKRNYVLPLMNVSCGDILLNLKNGSSMNLAAVVPILGVKAGTSSLYPWQGATLAAGADPNKANPVPVLAGLTDPLQVYVKPAGSGAENYARIPQRSTLPHINPNLNTTNAFSSSMCWAWIGNQLVVTPTNIDLVIEVTGRFSAAPLIRDDQFIPGGEDLWIPLVFDTASIVGVERSNPQVLEGYATRSLRSQDNLLADIIRQGQGAPARFQKASRDSGNGYIAWFWGL